MDRRRDSENNGTRGGAEEGVNNANSSNPNANQPRPMFVDKAKVVEAFAGLVRTKLSTPEVIKRMDDRYNRQDGYAAEKKVLADMNNNGLAKGFFFGLGTFFVLRRFPPVLKRYLLSRQCSPGGAPGYKFDAAAKTYNNPFRKNATSNNASSLTSGSSGAGAGAGSASGGEKRPSSIVSFFKLGLDLFVATTLAGYASMYFTDRRKMIQQLSDLPLVEGRSLISEEFCSDFEQEFKRIPKNLLHHPTTSTGGQHQPHETNLTFLDTGVSAIHTFVVNCRKRTAYQEQLRAERGLQPGGSSGPIPMPSGGVPRDIEYTLEYGGNENDSNDGEWNELDSSSTDTDMFADQNNWKGQGTTGEMSDWSSIDDFEKNGSKKRPRS